MALFDSNEKEVSLGYVGKETAPVVFPVERVVSIRSYFFNGIYYFKPKDIANLMGLKQPSQFTRDLKDYIGEEKVLKGLITRSFRDKDDDERSPFIPAKEIYGFLLDPVCRNQKCDPEMRRKVAETLELYF